MLNRDVLMEMGPRYPQIGPTLIMRFANSRDSVVDLLKLWTLAEKGRVPIEFQNPAVVAAVLISRDWGMGCNRDIAVRFPHGAAFRDDLTLDALAILRSVESLKFANQNPLNALMTGRQKKQHDCAEEIIWECLTQDIIDDVEQWGLSLTGMLDTSIKELPGIKFTIKHGAETISEILLDGWSGCILANKEIQPVAYGGGRQVRKIINSALDSYMEKATAND